MTPDVIARRVVVHGRVQGVGYRDAAVQAAFSLNVKGWVRNRRDGSVEALACGPTAAVQALIEWARRGPELARVAGVVVTEGAAEETLVGFGQRETV